MSFDHVAAAPSGQTKVLEAWRKRLRGRSFITCEDIDISAINRELAYVSILSCEDGGQFRFRLAGTGLAARCSAAKRAARRRTRSMRAVAGRCGPNWRRARCCARCRFRARRVLADGSMHYWLRLPLSSNGVEADMVLCHDRYLPAEARSIRIAPRCGSTCRCAATGISSRPDTRLSGRIEFPGAAMFGGRDAERPAKPAREAALFGEAKDIRNFGQAAGASPAGMTRPRECGFAELVLRRLSSLRQAAG